MVVGTSNGRFGDGENHEHKQKILKCRITDTAETIFFIWKTYVKFINNLDSSVIGIMS